MPAAARADSPGPFLLAGLPLASWAYATRIWLAMMIALAAAFWLQLDSASSAAVTVAILAQPRRGQAFQKAAYRLGATAVGVIASIAITAVFTQSRDLFVVAFATWMAIAVYVAALYDGNRAYGAVLSGYTVAIVAVMQIDSPQDVFMDGITRLAVVSLGIASIALVNDVFAAPDLYPSVRQRLVEAHGSTRAMVLAFVRGAEPAPERVVKLFSRITSTRLDVLTLPSEGPAGAPRSAAAASAIVAMVGSIMKAKAFAAMARDIPAADLTGVRQAIEAADPDALEATLDAVLASDTRTPDRVMLATLAVDLVEQQRLAADGLAAMLADREPERRVALPIHRSQELARLAALRVFCAILISSVIFILSSWPMTSVAFSLVGVLAGLSSTTPDPRAFAKGAMIAMPIAVVVAGVTEFLILDGADAFPLLALGLAPAIFGACFLFLNPKTSGIGFLLLVFLPVIFPPSNPQSYNPQSYVLTGALAVGAIMLFSMLLFAFFPVSDKDRRRWLVNRAREDLLEALAERPRRTAAEATYLAADRLVALAGFKVGFEAAKRWRLSYAMLLSVLTIIVTRGQDELESLRRAGTSEALIGAARDAFSQLDAGRLRDAAEALLRDAPREACDERRRTAHAVADLQLAARVVGANRSTLRHLRSGIAA